MKPPRKLNPDQNFRRAVEGGVGVNGLFALTAEVEGTSPHPDPRPELIRRGRYAKSKGRRVVDLTVDQTTRLS